jgi:hypothetical protein
MALPQSGETRQCLKYLPALSNPTTTILYSFAGNQKNQSLDISAPMSFKSVVEDLSLEPGLALGQNCTF